MDMSETSARIDEIVAKNDVVLFMKGTALFPQCGFSSRAVAILDHLGVAFETVDVLQDPEIRQGIPDARVEITDLAGDGDHYAARVVAESFRGMPRVRQHQRVYEALGGRMGNELHALKLTTALPD